MFTIDATLAPEPTTVELVVTDQTPATAAHPPLATLCVRNTSDTSVTLSGGQTLPLSQYSAHDASQPRRIIVFPTALNDKQQVIPDAPTDATWAMANAFYES